MKPTRNVQKLVLAILLISSSFLAQAACKEPAPRATAFANPGGGSCPSGYYSSGKACVAVSENSCNAFFSGSGSCPSGYFSSGKSCLAN